MSCVLVSRVGSGRVVRVRGGGWLLAVASRSVAGLGVRVFILARPATRRAGSSFPPLAPGDPQAFFSGVLFWTLGFRGGLWGGRQRSWPEHVEAAPMCVSPGRKAAWTRKRGALARERRRLGKKEGVGLRAGACDWRLAERERERGRKAAQVLFSGLRAAATAFPFFFFREVLLSSSKGVQKWQRRACFVVRLRCQRRTRQSSAGAAR